MAIDQRSIGRDTILVGVLTELLTGHFDVNIEDLLTPEEADKTVIVAGTLTEYKDNDAIIAEAKALLREHLDRILSVEVADSGEDNAQ